MSEDLRRFNRFPPKGIFLPSILDIYSKMKILLEAVRWLKRLQTIRAPLAPAAGSFIPAKCVMRLENTFCCFPSPQQRTAAAAPSQWRRTAAALRRRRQPEAAAAPCMASYIAVHRKTLCSPIFVFFSSHIIIFRWQALQFGFVPSQPSCQSRILYASNTTNQPFA